jgi:cell filamentation protein
MDPYVYPGTNVLKNLRDIRDPERLARFEADTTSERLTQLEEKPLNGKFDAQHLQAIHRYIFQDTFDWAGEFRTVNIGKSGDFFALHQHIASSLGTIFDELKTERWLAGADPGHFCNRGAYFLAEINAIHPFREGNGRAQREFIRQLALRNGYVLEWSRVSREQMLEASIQEFSKR